MNRTRSAKSKPDDRRKQNNTKCVQKNIVSAHAYASFLTKLIKVLSHTGNNIETASTGKKMFTKL